MKKLTAVFLTLMFSAGAAAFAAQAGKTAPAKKAAAAAKMSPLASETDPMKIQTLVQSADYKAVTVDEYMSVMKNLVTVGKSVDISSAEGRKKAGLVYMSVLVFQKKSKNPGSYMDADGKSIVDDNWLDGKSASVADSLKKSTKAQYEAKYDEKFSADEKKMREEFLAAKAAAK